MLIREYLRLAIQSNKMTTIEEILCRIEKGGTLDMLANEFGIWNVSRVLKIME